MTTEPIIIEAEMYALATGGACVGEILSPEAKTGKKAFIPYTIPGEKVTGEVTFEKPSYVEAKLLQILIPSPDRQTPPCKYFGTCGGCDLQHMNLRAQREYKRKMVEDTLRIQAKVAPADGVSILGENLPGLHYRRRVSLHLNREGQLGFYMKHGRKIAEIDECLIVTHAINQIIKSHRTLLAKLAPEAETVTIEDHGGKIFIALELFPRNEPKLDSLIAKPEFTALQSLVYSLQVNYRHKKIYPFSDSGQDSAPVGHFSQNFDAANKLMQEKVLELAAGEKITDLYAGAGNLSFPLAKNGAEVLAVELDPALVKYGESIRDSLGLDEKLRFERSSCEKWIEKNSAGKVVVLDPPRSGAMEVAKQLDPLVTQNIVYVSCYLATFARDIGLMSARGFTLKKVWVLDMFPETYHVEIIAHLVPSAAT